LFTSSHATVASVTGFAWVFLILSGFAVAASLQGLYQRIFGLDSRITRDMPRSLIWIVLALAWAYLSSLIGPQVRAGAPVVFAIVGLIAIGVVIILGAVTGPVWQEGRSRLALPSENRRRTRD
jgi:hypothetical protein